MYSSQGLKAKKVKIKATIGPERLDPFIYLLIIIIIIIIIIFIRTKGTIVH